MDSTEKFLTAAFEPKLAVFFANNCQWLIAEGKQSHKKNTEPAKCKNNPRIPIEYSAGKHSKQSDQHENQFSNKEQKQLGFLAGSQSMSQFAILARHKIGQDHYQFAASDLFGPFQSALPVFRLGYLFIRFNAERREFGAGPNDKAFAVYQIGN